MTTVERLTAVLALFALLFATPVAADRARYFENPFDNGKERISLNRFMHEKDSNRDPNWDWTIDQTYTLELHNGPRTVSLPYYSNFGPAASQLDLNDIHPEDGWELLMRDFGPTPVAYFMLYNKYRGILRFFYFAEYPENYTLALARLSYKDDDRETTAAHFTLLEDGRYLDDYDPEKVQIVISEASNQQWAYADFDVSGFDPNIGNKDASFTIRVTGVLESFIELEGEVDLLTRPISATVPRGDISEKLEGAKKRFKDLGDLKDNVTDLVKGIPGLEDVMNGINSLTGSIWFKKLKPAAAVLDFVLGGGSTNSNLPAPLVTTGTLNLNGTIQTSSYLYELTFRVPGSRPDPNEDGATRMLPLYDLPLGLLNVESAPSYSATLTSDRLLSPFPPISWTIEADIAATSPLEIVYNQHVFHNVDVQANWAPPNRPAWGWVPLTEFNSGWNRTISGTYRDFYLWNDLLHNRSYFTQIAIQAELTPIDAAPDLEPVVLYKVYPSVPDLDLEYDFGGGGGCIFFCSIWDASAENKTRSIDELVRDLVEQNQRERSQVAPVTLDDYIDDYALLLAQLSEGGISTIELDTAREAYLVHLARLNMLDGWSESDLRMLEVLALRKLLPDFAL